MRRALTSLCILVVFFISAAAAHAARSRPVETSGPSPAAAAAATAGPAFTLEQYSFDDEFGNPDAQGWTSHDLTAQPEKYFHVDDFAGAGAPYAPLSGSQSLWCGVYCGSGEGCTYATSPGYGNDWTQDFTSDAFPVGAGNVTLSYQISYDVEQDFDYVRVQYLSKTGGWNPLAEYTGTGSFSDGAVIPGDSLDGSVRVRFRVTSDGSISDEDGGYDSNGAVVLDNITLSGTGLFEFQDFEAEAVGDTATADGAWGAQRSAGFGDYAGLFDGGAVLQEDPAYTNVTNFWGFFAGSTDDYSCGGHPEQPVVPFPRGQLVEDFINNEIRSPFIDLSATADGTTLPAADSVAVEFDVYRDLPADNAVFYKVRARFDVGGIPTSWDDLGYIYYGDFTTWTRQSVEFDVPAGATAVQVALGVVDLCIAYCPAFYSGSCHSHGPLFDNVAVRVIADAITVTSTADSGAGSLRQAILDANASPGFDLIAFNIAGAGPHVIQPLTNLPIVSERVTIDGYTQPGATPNTLGPDGGTDAQIVIELDGSLLQEDSGLAVMGDSTVVRGLAIHSFPSSAVAVYAPGCAVEGCFLGTDATGTVDRGNAYGVRAGIAGSSGLRVGGDDPAARNLISGNDVAGVSLAAGTGHVVAGNRIGVNAGATGALGNLNGVHFSGADACTVGGDTPSERNLISGNTEAGILFTNSSDNNVVTGNYIGVRPAGYGRRPNGTHGIEITGSSNTRIGGYDPGEGNVVSGNDGNGIYDDATGTLIVGNAIGGDATGTIATVNAAHGVELTATSTGAVVGHDSLSGGNRIAYNDLDGVRSLSPRFTVSANSFYFNGFEGIDTGDDGVGTASPDPSFLPAPVVTSAAKPGTVTTVTGTVDGPPNATLRLEFFADDVICDISGYGEGRRYLGHADVTTDGGGAAAFSVDVSGAEADEFLTATSTAPDSLTSEFSACVTVVNTPPGTDVEVTLADGGSQTVSATFDSVDGAGQTTLQYTQSCDALPGGFVVGDSAGCFDIQTTASFSGNVEVCVQYDEADVGQPENALRILHYNDATLEWEDVTTGVDTTANIVCGTTPTLSPFVVARFDDFTGIAGDGTPARFALRQNVPNPFNPTTAIAYNVPAGGARVTIRVYDVAGRHVRTLVDRRVPAGTARAVWDGTDARGRAVSSGVYFYRMNAGSFTQTKKMVLLK